MDKDLPLLSEVESIGTVEPKGEESHSAIQKSRELL
jgi:hypothetical protein